MSLDKYDGEDGKRLVENENRRESDEKIKRLKEKYKKK